MQNMVALQEQNISQLTTQLVRLHADLAVVKARRQNSDNRDLSTMKEAHLKEEMHEYQEKWASSKKEGKFRAVKTIKKTLIPFTDLSGGSQGQNGRFTTGNTTEEGF